VSEYQYVAFRAVDGPVSEENLEYMHRQSSRADITPWTFENEYHYGDFRGDALEMLRRGYDLHLHYANFGTRTLLIRFPQGLPDAGAYQPYAVQGALEFIKDKQGPGGCLSIDPYHEAGTLDELWEADGLLDQLISLRKEILEGDLRPLYLAHLAAVSDDNHDPDEALEAPVPAGLEQLSAAQSALAELCGISESLIAAAAQESPPLPEGANGLSQLYEAWVTRQSEAAKNAWLTAVMNDTTAVVRAELLAKCRQEIDVPAWPTTRPARTVRQLQSIADEIARNIRLRAAAKAAREREQRLHRMAADPDTTLRETERLVGQRSTDSYRQAAVLLAELREALSTGEQSGLADQQARKLKEKYPTLHRLTGELRSQGFLPK
jgi:hypothetical protein